MFIVLLEIGSLALICLVFISQVLLPFINGTPFFPYWRITKHSVTMEDAEKELAETTEAVLLKKRLADIKRQQSIIDAQAAALNETGNEKDMK